MSTTAIDMPLLNPAQPRWLMADSSSLAVGRVDRAIEAMLVACMIFAPLAFGAVEAWSELVVILLAGAMGICLALRTLVSNQYRWTWSWSYLPIAAFGLLVCLQLVPLPMNMVAAISPHTAQAKLRLLGDGVSAPTWACLSFYPQASLHDLRLVLAVLTVFVAVVNVIRTTAQVKRLLWSAAIIGGGVAILALLQDACGTDKIYWLVPSGMAKANSGPFVNHSHFAQFMNLSIGAALALVLVRLRELFGRSVMAQRGAAFSAADVIEQITDRSQRGIWLLGGMIALSVAAIFLSFTRGGMVSTLIAAGFTCVLLSLRRGLNSRGWALMLMTMGALVCVLYVGFQSIYERLATLQDLHHYQDRCQILTDLRASIASFPAVGTGLGTHEVVYPMFDHSTQSALAAHAENEYIQTAEETGVVGLLLVLAFLCVVAASYIRCIKKHSLPIGSAAFGLGFGLLAVLINSLSDFGQHVPANAILSAISCGLLIVLPRLDDQSSFMGTAYRPSTTIIPPCLLTPLKTQARPEPASCPHKTPAARRFVGVVALIIAVCAVWWSSTNANDARAAQAQFDQALRIEQSLAQDGWLGSDQQYSQLIRHASAACQLQDQDVKYRHWLNVYRWHSISRQTDDNGNVIFTPQTQKIAAKIAADLDQTRRLCPTFGATWCLWGQIELSVLGQESGKEHIRIGYELAPCDATANFVAGELDGNEGDFDAALPKLSKAVKLDEHLFNDAASLLIDGWSQGRQALALAGSDPLRLLKVSQLLDRHEQFHDLSLQANDRAVALMQELCRGQAAPAWMLAAMGKHYSDLKDYAQAVGYYRRAARADYAQVQWHLALAQSLRGAGEPKAAMQEARTCLRLRPNMAGAVQLVSDLSASVQE